METTLADWLSDVLTVAQAAAVGDLDASVPGQYICVAYVYPDGASAEDQTTRLVKVGGVTGTPESGSCFDDGRLDDERRVQVVVRRSGTIQAVLFSRDITLAAEAAAGYERRG